MPPFIQNAADTPLEQQTGTLPQVGEAITDYFRSLIFTMMTKTIIGGFVHEAGTPVPFRGSVQPLSPRRIELKPIGQRAWTWLWIHAEPIMNLEVDDKITFQGVETRIMAKKDYSAFGYIEYEACQGWTES